MTTTGVQRIGVAANSSAEYQKNSLYLAAQMAPVSISNHQLSLTPSCTPAPEPSATESCNYRSLNIYDGQFWAEGMGSKKSCIRCLLGEEGGRESSSGLIMTGGYCI